VKARESVVVGLVFLVSFVGLALAFSLLLDNVALGIGPAIAVAVGISTAAYIAVRKKA